MAMRTLTILALCAVLIVELSSCRPRSQRTSKQRQQASRTTAATPGAPTAKQVMARTDSVLANLGSMSDDVTDIPPRATMDEYPRTSWGAPMMAPRPDLSGYGTFESALANFNGSRYDEAVGLFTQIAVSGRPPELVPNAYYWIGESYYAMHRYAEALQYFEYTTKAGPSYKREIAFYKLARANRELGNDQAAQTWYERLRAEYPKSSYVSSLRKLGIR
jgi:TolA-binding protein